MATALLQRQRGGHEEGDRFGRTKAGRSVNPQESGAGGRRSSPTACFAKRALRCRTQSGSAPPYSHAQC
eukprot:15446717-Alexandrium_andersonii.AAC.1